MSKSDVAAILPIIIPAITAALVTLGLALRRSHRVTLALTLGGLAAALLSLPAASLNSPHWVSSLLVMDGYASVFIGLVLSAGLAVTLLAYGYLERCEEPAEEFYVFLLLATSGGATLAASGHFATFFLGLEILSVSLYTQAAYRRESALCIEAGVKYLVLAGASSAFLLFGMALVYAELGTMSFAGIASALRAGGPVTSPLVLAGMGMIVVALGFKLGVVPFHLWTPDVYQGAPAPASAFIATVSKGAVFALLLRYFRANDVHLLGPLSLAFSAIAVLSMLGGNLLALLQNNVKRILAYSSIAHLGYLLVAFLASGPLAVAAAAYYLLAYFAASLGAWGVVVALSDKDRDADEVADYQGLLWRRPGLAVVFTVMLLSLAGMPLTAGFIGKFCLVSAGASSALWGLVVLLVLSSVIGLYYYLRIIAAVFTPTPGSAPSAQVSLPLVGGAALLALILLVLWLGVYPAPVIALLQAVALACS